MQHVVLITTKQPSSNPRLLKEAVCLSEAGYKVSVVYNFWSSWAEKADVSIVRKYPAINWVKAASGPGGSATGYWYTRIRFKIFRILATVLKSNRWLQASATSQFYPELKKNAVRLQAALYIAHNIGALPAAAAAAKKNNSRYAFDAEDYHRSLDETNQEEGRIATQLENAYFNNAAYITAASPMIAAAYKKNYPLKDFVVINNVFSVSQQPAFSNIVQQPLKLFWFSQTVGLKRGIQDVINAINNIRDFTIEFSVLGDASAAIKAQLQSLLLNSKHSIHFIPPCNEEELIRLAAMHHIGLALEPGFSLNNKIALSNKLFTYLLAGNAVIVSNTPAQELYYNSYPDTAWCYQIGNIKQLTAIIQQAGTDEVLLNIKRKAAWQAANTTLNWETEQQQFLKLVKAIA